MRQKNYFDGGKIDDKYIYDKMYIIFFFVEKTALK